MTGMKQCPQCSAEYGDTVNFCARDGKSLVVEVSTRARLCPHCANGIPQDAPTCPYCKADLDSSPAPQWPTRDEAPPQEVKVERNKIPARSKVILIAGIVLFALGVYLIGGQRERSDAQLVLQEKLRELREKEQKIETLESLLARVRQELAEHSGQLTELKTKFEESRKELSASQQRLAIATREVDRLSASRTQPATRTSPRSVDPPSPSPARRVAEPGVYEIIRATPVYEEASASSRVVTQISQGTRINVVRSVGEWLEVRSKQGNPPGFVRWDDARFVGKSN
jgi:hypothetical protein